ncbi:hypothetical protein FOZ63_026696 [Perkinsus olseni]|uniref:Uncharacterized protein n=1 Tax=Perkinsus olseni TaxID=32597 RepID=A0A7J6QGL4_PEROL|nr:hypothetical protein FOZ63_026696 [Perkinsus olseni]
MVATARDLSAPAHRVRFRPDGPEVFKALSENLRDEREGNERICDQNGELKEENRKLRLTLNEMQVFTVHIPRKLHRSKPAAVSNDKLLHTSEGENIIEEAVATLDQEPLTITAPTLARSTADDVFESTPVQKHKFLFVCEDPEPPAYQMQEISGKRLRYLFSRSIFVPISSGRGRVSDASVGGNNNSTA